MIFVVCPFEVPLLERVPGRSVVVDLDDISEIPRVMAETARLEQHIHCLRVQCEGALSSISFEAVPPDVPLALHVPSLGAVPELIAKLPLLRERNIRVYLPATSKENNTALRILASLGIASAVVFSEESDWEALRDLLTYALLGLVPHAAIDPFDYLAERYDRARRNNFASVYFDNPETYLHLDADGHVALTAEDLAEGRFLDGEPETLDQVLRSEEYELGLARWQQFFLENHGCASCPGWRVCLGRFSQFADKAGCKGFTSELMDVLELSKAREAARKQVWQP